MTENDIQYLDKLESDARNGRFARTAIVHCRTLEVADCASGRISQYGYKCTIRPSLDKDCPFVVFVCR